MATRMGGSSAGICFLVFWAAVMATSCEKWRQHAHHSGSNDLSTRAELATSSPSAGNPSQGDWTVFPPYPGARYLCYQCVMGFGSSNRPVGINWSAFASRDEPKVVIAFYSRSQHAAFAADGDGSVTYQTGDRHILSIYPAAPAKYPTCDKALQAGEKTVIVISSRSAP